jgi:N-acetylglutamate synthase/N-acetylornithine aminotransferase
MGEDQHAGAGFLAPEIGLMLTMAFPDASVEIVEVSRIADDS